MYINDDCCGKPSVFEEVIKEEECCDCKVENKPSYDELKRQLEKANIQLNRKDTLIEGLERAMITNTIRIRDLEFNVNYWQDTYYRENERANKLYDELRELKEGKN